MKTRMYCQFISPKKNISFNSIYDNDGYVKKTIQRTHRRRRLPFFCFFPSFLFLFFVLVLRERKATDYQIVEMLINLNFRANEEKWSRSGETSNKIKTRNKAVFCKVLQPFM